MSGGIFGSHNWGIEEPKDREMSFWELVTHPPMDSFLSLVMLRLQPKCGFIRRALALVIVLHVRCP